MDQKQKEKTAFGGSGSSFNQDLSITKEIKAPSVEEVLRAAKLALQSAKKTIRERKEGVCGCF
jgi:hypothetical protein